MTGSGMTATLPRGGDIAFDAAVPRVGQRLAYLVTKRVIDVLGSLALLLLSAPIIAVVALLVRLDSPGPVIFRQARVGRGGGTFTFYKFRTMWSDAATRFPDFYAYDYREDDLDGLYFKLADDPRLTRFGRVLRRTSFDELPNLWNVLKGDMSLVGPRPEIPAMVRHYRTDQLAKFGVKPGLTGLAQTHGRNILRFEETIAQDLSYVATASLATDARILLRTPYVVVRMLGAL